MAKERESEGAAKEGDFCLPLPTSGIPVDAYHGANAAGASENRLLVVARECVGCDDNFLSHPPCDETAKQPCIIVRIDDDTEGVVELSLLSGYVNTLYASCDIFFVFKHPSMNATLAFKHALFQTLTSIFRRQRAVSMNSHLFAPLSSSRLLNECNTSRLARQRGISATLRVYRDRTNQARPNDLLRFTLTGAEEELLDQSEEGTAMVTSAATGATRGVVEGLRFQKRCSKLRPMADTWSKVRCGRWN